MKKSKRVFCMVAAMFCLGAFGCGETEPPPSGFAIPFETRTYQTDGQLYTAGNVQYPASLWETPTYEFAEDLNPENSEFAGIKAFFLNSPVRYNGKPTKIMGYVGFPKGASASAKVPGIVLVHGGGGTAFADWVKRWNDRGYAAVSIDTEGAEALPQGGGAHNARNRYEDDEEYTAGPANTGFAMSGLEQIENCWMYHAASAVILANSMLRADERVDENKVGITGVSWGGLLTTVVTGYDDRFAFAMPVYGSVGLEDTYGFVNNFPSELSRETWDTLEPVRASNTPTLWVNSNKDAAFSLEATTRCYDASKNGYLAVINALPHDQQTGSTVAELSAFADAAIGKSNRVVRITRQPTAENPVLEYKLGTDVKLKSARLFYTEQPLASTAVWKSQTLETTKEETSIRFRIPVTAKFCYVTLTYDSNLSASTTMIACEAQA